MTHISCRSKDLTVNEAFPGVREQCFLWQKVTPFDVDIMQ